MSSTWAYSNSICINESEISLMANRFRGLYPGVYNGVEDIEVVRMVSSMYGFSFHHAEDYSEIFYPYSLYVEQAVIQYLKIIADFAPSNVRIEFSDGHDKVWMFYYAQYDFHNGKRISWMGVRKSECRKYTFNTSESDMYPWARYCRYLAEWASERQNPMYTGLEPMTWGQFKQQISEEDEENIPLF